jgi:hypothetical protein
MKWAGRVVRIWEKRNAYRALVGKPEGNRPRQWHRPVWEDNIKINLTKIGWGYGFDSSDSEYKLVVGSYEHDNKTFWLRKILGKYWVDERLLTSQERLDSIELVSSCVMSFSSVLTTSSPLLRPCPLLCLPIVCILTIAWPQTRHSI